MTTAVALEALVVRDLRWQDRCRDHRSADDRPGIPQVRPGGSHLRHGAAARPGSGRRATNPRVGGRCRGSDHRVLCWGHWPEDRCGDRCGGQGDEEDPSGRVHRDEGRRRCNDGDGLPDPCLVRWPSSSVGIREPDLSDLCVLGGQRRREIQAPDPLALEAELPAAVAGLS